ncbi:aspartate/glutamate racemase family protein [Thermodesulfobacteriota bacterium]
MNLRDGQYGWLCRLGLILPSMNVLNEPEWYRILPDGISVHTARMLLHGAMTAESFRHMHKDISRAALMLSTGHVDAIAYACTAGSFLEDSEKIIRIIERESNVPVVTTSRAVIEALHALQIKRVAVATPYIESVNESERKFLENAGFEVTRIIGLDLGHTSEERLLIARQKESVTYELAKRVESPEADGVFISCVALASVGILKKLEDNLSKPVFSSTVATLWAILRRSGVDVSIEGFGSLLEKFPPLPELPKYREQKS